MKVTGKHKNNSDFKNSYLQNLFIFILGNLLQKKLFFCHCSLSTRNFVLFRINSGLDSNITESIPDSIQHLKLVCDLIHFC